ncbi:MAG: GntR family transcriptional regulator [Pseudomonadota bacterium]|uniref:GntR family transcriptional regulator n=1 Tax=Thalassovita sp. TaxID=1979401 RepID=UPI002AB0B785|nr:GntR family transcriptional regulator [Thalassovita sp.]MEC8039777.1 GntR family transcriptional regulator [Pseudomonadota bacterium]MEC8292016.1 GntR family transcriptional regulator [Pseudomonadota bacterium]
MKPIVMTLAAQTAAILRDEILSGDIRPGAVLLPAEISKRLGVSQAPVREGLQYLVAQGLVEKKPNKSAVVATMGGNELIELAATIFALELSASIRGTLSISDDNVRAMGSVLEQMRDRTLSASKWYDLNQLFHSYLFRSSNWPTMIQKIEDGRENLKRFQVDDELVDPNFDAFDDEHAAIFNSVQERNLEAASEALKVHFDNSVALLEAKFCTSD